MDMRDIDKFIEFFTIYIYTQKSQWVRQKNLTPTL